MATTPHGSRPDTDEYFLRMAELVSTRATCSRRRVGCVLVDRDRHVLATGYNGVPAGEEHCIDVPCAGAGLASGTGLNLCRAVHAEANALTQCRNVYQIHTAYVTASPCVQCMGKLITTSVKRIVFRERYPHAESELTAISRGIEWLHVPGGHDVPRVLSGNADGPEQSVRAVHLFQRRNGTV
jgi:dCMP deaminase